MLALSASSPSAMWASGGDLYWLESRPLEKGRRVLLRRTPDGKVDEVTLQDFNVRTTVHEYGGGAFFVSGETVFFSNFVDQRLYRVDGQQNLRAITPEPAFEWQFRYADGRLSPDGRWIVCVREEHYPDTEAVNALVIFPADGSAAPRVLVDGHDFFSTPRFSPGGQLAWLSWDHPNMPWDGCDLWVADLTPDGYVKNILHVAGGAEESIFQPEWSPSGKLFFVSDRSGWWNLYSYNGKVEQVVSMEAEFGQPQWNFGSVSYLFLPDERIVCIYSQDGRDYLGLIDGQDLKRLALDYTVLWSPAFDGEHLWLGGASPTVAPVLFKVDLDDIKVEVVRTSLNLAINPAFFSLPRAIEFPTENGLTAHAFYYPPTNPNYTAPAGEKPPLLVISHGGPTGAAHAVLSLGILFWTSRGFGIVDVNYGGSTGYGRAYWQRLKGQWGVVDVLDCINAARYLAEKGEVDAKRIIVRGGSAGGYTTLCGLAFHKFFAAGASYFGLADLDTFVKDTHKFESRYLESLIGPYPQARELYMQRSPIYYAKNIACPVILFQGLEDKVVPPSQSEVMVKALDEKGAPYAYLAFEGEQHGFRKAETIRRAAEAELYFYSRVFGFELPESIEPVEIKNWRK